MRRLVTVVSVGALSFAVYLAYVTDAGPGNRAATCSVRVSDECLAQYPALHRYERVRFPVRRSVLADGGIQILLPRALGDPNGIARDCIEVMDWASCDLDACATYPATCASWDAGQPISLVGVVKPWCRQGPGKPCVGLDGGTMGNRNVGLCSLRADPATCERVSSGVIYLGDNPETDLQ